MSQEYLASLVLIIGSILKLFDIEIENSAIEAVVAGGLSLWIIVRRIMKKDITVFGVRK